MLGGKSSREGPRSRKEGRGKRSFSAGEGLLGGLFPPSAGLSAYTSLAS